MCTYIVFEGIDGAGKTTLIDNLQEILTDQGYKVKTIAEPADRSIDVSDPYLASLSFVLDRMKQQSELEWDEYDYVLSDRSYYSNLVYQSDDTELFYWINDLNHYVIEPDHIFFIDIPADIAVSREYNSLVPGIVFEFDIYRKRYYDVLPEDTIVIDALQPRTNLVMEVLRDINELR